MSYAANHSNHGHKCHQTLHICLLSYELTYYKKAKLAETNSASERIVTLVTMSESN